MADNSDIPRRRQVSRVYTEDETEDLLRLIEEKIKNIERKDRDQGPQTSEEKMEVWKEISRNLAAQGYAQRDPSTIKAKWNQMKCYSRKEWAEIRKDLYGTGGGPAKQRELSSTSRRVQDIMFLVTGTHTAFNGHTNRPDSDDIIESSMVPPSESAPQVPPRESAARVPYTDEDLAPFNPRHCSTQRDVDTTYLSGFHTDAPEFHEALRIHEGNTAQSHEEDVVVIGIDSLLEEDIMVTVDQASVSNNQEPQGPIKDSTEGQAKKDSWKKYSSNKLKRKISPELKPDSARSDKETARQVVAGLQEEYYEKLKQHADNEEERRRAHHEKLMAQLTESFINEEKRKTQLHLANMAKIRGEEIPKLSEPKEEKVQRATRESSGYGKKEQRKGSASHERILRIWYERTEIRFSEPRENPQDMVRKNREKVQRATRESSGYGMKEQRKGFQRVADIVD
ncbi:hypothetical protein WDU94_005407 [Cyamophila willieti]